MIDEFDLRIRRQIARFPLTTAAISEIEMPETEAIDRLYLELSQFTKAKTAREADLEALVKRSWDYVRRVRSMVVLSEDLDDEGARLMQELLSNLTTKGR